MFLIAVRHDVNNLESSVVVQELELCSFSCSLSLGCLLMSTIASFQGYTGYLNFINGPISLVLLLILVHAQLTKMSIIWTSCLTAIKTMSLNIAQQFMKGMVKSCFGLLKFR